MNNVDVLNIISDFLNFEDSREPTVLVADTIKGKGISFMENNIKWHGAIPSKDEVEIARRELNQHE